MTRLHEDVSMAKTEYGVVLLHQVTGKYWQLNKTAEVILASLSEGQDVAGAATALAARFDVTPEVARRDVSRLLTQLRANGVVVG
ncbi:lasso peptide biosynthesis PqqD family chaperone [Kibdelosporangium persicum]|uniref:Coenzyme PQQ synthesis protein D (PqqD) n=1 Tax=Kibdelosporangium persicum TaxID=2698649 RepID=A0ABX2FHH9_9PSEU|nr:lasso peptide biosynthesis PqqD family chaperone [Kibdelosporangium persicum]NRN70337.1 hypothetical protein [Kibdelosporangium persicum]